MLLTRIFSHLFHVPEEPKQQLETKLMLANTGKDGDADDGNCWTQYANWISNQYERQFSIPLEYYL